jgi:hypothetical protein
VGNDFFKTIAADAGAAAKSKPKAKPTKRKARDAKPAPAEPAAPKDEPAARVRPRGRPKGSGKQGKRSMRGYKLAGAYIRETTRDDVTDALSAENKKRKAGEAKRDYSDLVEELLTEWLKSRK